MPTCSVSSLRPWYVCVCECACVLYLFPPLPVQFLTAHQNTRILTCDVHTRTYTHTQVKEPPVVGDHEVPVFLRDAEVLRALDWDLALRQVIPHIDGVKYAKRLAMEAEVCVCVYVCVRVCVFI